MLRQFHFIDLNGKDQGINVRNRSKELVELLSDVEKIRTERKKARGNRTKYAGYEGGGGLGPGSMGGGSGSGMGGFGSENASAGYGQYNGGVYGDGGGFGGQSSDYQDTGISSSAAAPARRGDRFEEYDEYDEGAVAAPGRRKADSVSSPTARRTAKAPVAAKPKEPEEDLFDFGDEPLAAPSNGKAPATAGFNVLQSSTAPADDDDFDDFQSATPALAPAATSAFAIPPPNSTSTTTSATQFAQPQPRSGTQGQNITDLFASISPPPPRTGSTTSSTVANAGSAFMTPVTSTPSASAFRPPQQPAAFQPSGPNYFTSVPIAPVQQQQQNSTPVSLANLGKPASTPFGGAKKPAGGDAFASLLGGVAAKKPAVGQQGKVSMADMARQKASAGIWGASATPAAGGAQGQSQQKTGGGFDDLLG
jgi:epsin